MLYWIFVEVAEAIYISFLGLVVKKHADRSGDWWWRSQTHSSPATCLEYAQICLHLYRGTKVICRRIRRRGKVYIYVRWYQGIWSWATEHITSFVPMKYMPFSAAAAGGPCYQVAITIVDTKIEEPFGFWHSITNGSPTTAKYCQKGLL